MSNHKYSQTVCREYSQGVCHDGSAILKDGEPMTIEQIIEDLKAGQVARAEIASEEKLPHAGLEVMGNIQINEGGELQSYDRALVLTFNSNDEIRQAIAAEQCTFGFKE